MDIIILTGGKGSRLKSIVKNIPKTMVGINSSPFLDILLDYLHTQGFSRFILCTGIFGDYIKKYYQNNNKKKYAIEISQENYQLGTGGALKNCEKLVKSENFILINGDTLCKLNYRELISFHKNKLSFLTMVSGVPYDSGDYGGIVIDASNRVKSINKKSNQNYFNAGVYVFNKEVFNYLSTSYPYSIDSDFINSMLLKKNVFLYDSKKYFYDVGTPDRLEKFKNIYL